MLELKRVHGELIDVMDQFSVLTEAPVPDEGALAIARYRLARACSERRRQVEMRCIELEPRVEEDIAAELRGLRAAIAQQRGVALHHITAWGLSEVMRNWADYRATATAMNASLFDQIDRERQLLYPLLQHNSAQRSLELAAL